MKKQVKKKQATARKAKLSTEKPVKKRAGIPDRSHSEVQRLKRELEIEAALEKVRSRSNAMQQSNELSEVVLTVYGRLKSLGFDLSDGAVAILEFEEGSRDHTQWIVDPYHTYPTAFRIPYTDHLLCSEIFKARESGMDYISRLFPLKEKNKYFRFLFSHNPDYKSLPGSVKKFLLKSKEYGISAALSKHSGILIPTNTGKLLSDKQKEILIRFSSVFDQAYTRFLDLKRAEAQAREAQIEAAMEKIRSRSLAMHHSGELKDVIAILFEKLSELKTLLGTIGIQLFEDETQNSFLWVGNAIQDPQMINLPQDGKLMRGENCLHDMWDARRNGKDIINKKYSRKQKDKFFNYIFSNNDYVQVPENAREILRNLSSHIVCLIVEQNSALLADSFTGEFFSDEQVLILKRAAKVFEQAYIRFLDLEKAEAQAREAQIEAALERVRSRALAMHSSKEITDVIKEVRRQMDLLGQKELDTCVIQLYDESPDYISSWASMMPSQNKEEVRDFNRLIPKKGLLIQEEALQAYSSGRKDYVILNEKGKMKQWIGFMKKTYPEIYAAYKETVWPAIPEETPTYWSFSDFTGGSMLMITFTPPADASRELLRRFASVFGLAYQRFADLKKAEAQAREAQIQLALERVRARTMAMQSSSELAEVSFLLNKQVVELGIPTRGCAFNIYNEHDSTEWFSNLEGTLPTYKTPREKVFLKYYEGGQRGETLLIEEYGGKKIKDLYKYLFKAGIFGKGDVTEEKINEITPEFQIDHVAYFKYGYLLFITLVPAPEAHDVFRRFAKEFEQTYTRFLDLQKAEAQAREARIEAALERIRSAAMAMHSSDGILDVTQVLREQIALLGEKELESILVHIYHEDTDQFEAWYSYRHPENTDERIRHGKQMLSWSQTARARKDKEKYNEAQSDYTIVADYKMLKEWYEYLLVNVPEVVEVNKEGKPLVPEVLYYNYSKITNGTLLLITNSEASDHSKYLLRRAAAVFNLAYSRFLDLQKAEAQAREAQIEAALEKVRSSSLAMHKSDELKHVIVVVFEKLKELGLTFDVAGIQLYTEGSKDIVQWVAALDLLSSPVLAHLPYSEKDFMESEVIRDIWTAKETGKSFLNRNYSFEEKNKFFEFAGRNNDTNTIPVDVRKFQMEAPGYTQTLVAEKHSALWVDSYRGQTILADEFVVLGRFARVFEQAYVRFLDLQKAEAQAREAQIQLALERVRARTMAMHKSDELSEVVQVLFEEYKKLHAEAFSATLARGFINIINESNECFDLWITEVDGSKIQKLFTIKFDEPTTGRPLYKSWKRKERWFIKDMQGEELNRWFDYLVSTGFNIPPGLRGTRRINNFIFFSSGYLGITSTQPLTEESLQLLLRFAKVFEQTYTRFLDLQKAEAQAREAQIEAALERVRSRTMGMQRSDELQDAALLLFQQVSGLGVPAFGCGFNIWDEDRKFSTAWMAGQDRLQPPFKTSSSEDIFLRIYESAQRGESLFVEEQEGEALKVHYDYMNSIPVFKDIAGKMAAVGQSFPTFQIMHCSFFSQGYLMFITFEPVPNAYDIFRRFAKVFEQTYTRFLDLQKAEAQAREAQIEAALERVRSRSIAMRKSEEIANIAAKIFNELRQLDLVLNRVLIWTFNDTERYTTWWSSNPEVESTAESYRIDYNENPVFINYLQAWQQRKPIHLFTLSGDTKKTWEDHLFEHTEMSRLPMEVRKGMREEGTLYTVSVISDYGLMMSGSLKPLSEASIDIIQRFGRVFQQSYTRYLDVQKAEAQAREAQIEAALERVRAQTMAMHNSEDVGKCIVRMFAELTAIGVDEGTRFGIGILNHDNENIQLWTASRDGEEVNLHIGNLDMTWHPLLKSARKAWKERVPLHQYVLEGEDLVNYYQMINNAPDYKFRIAIEKLPEREFHYGFVFDHGFFYAFSHREFQAELIRITQRFSSVFGQTYRRYLDLVKAEAQAREAQIEASLERVRARTMAMHKSEELSEVASLLFQQIGELGIKVWTAGFNVWLNNDTGYQDWITSPKGGFIEPYIVDTTQFPVFIEVREAKQRGDDFFVQYVGGEMIEAMYKELSKFAPKQFEIMLQDGFEFPKQQYDHFVFGSNVSLMFITFEPLPEAHDIFKRFGKVFEQTYTRFLDLQKAEAQAREAQIEAALERVRAKAMAMHSSQDLADTIGTFYTQLKLFNLVPRRCGVGLLNKHNKEGEVFTWNTTENGESLELVGKIRMDSHPVLENVYNSWITQTEYHPVLRGNEIREYYKVIRPQVAFPEYQNDEVHYGYFFMFEEGGVYAWKETPLKEDELTIYRRFTSVLSLTYKRYKDLKDAEARAKEAVKQATLDRVRAEIASMRTVVDLDRITPLIWRELTTLGVSFVRCGVFIMDEEKQIIQTFLSTPDGRAIAAFHLPYDAPGRVSEILTNWMNKREYIEHWDEAAFSDLGDLLVQQGALPSKDVYLQTIPQDGIHLHCLPFLQGMLYVGNTEKLKADDIQLIQAVADAFSTAYARYEDFNKLEAAKQQVDKTLADLKQAQQQLVQSEKMASLGELTAGIAHEIQNPLNFVNNFSEVNKELLAEMEEAIQKGNYEEAIAIAKDISDNQKKINHHGKRAEGIVKGMLQHSRTSSGQKELTDINALCDEYLRLSYHGLRAKDKSFNAKFDINFDESLPKISVVPQDIGRVILNLINNAFYAVSEKYKSYQAETVEASRTYQPQVIVSTKNLNDKIEISVRDNGKGIPDAIREKIFQPFFTTKPTGQGTGLGLSLSYDIIKAHGGELFMYSEPGKGSTFTIKLPL